MGQTLNSLKIVMQKWNWHYFGIFHAKNQILTLGYLLVKVWPKSQLKSQLFDFLKFKSKQARKWMANDNSNIW